MNGSRSVTVYRCLTALYPASFRRHYRDDLVAAFAELVRDVGAAMAWRTAVLDLVLTIPTQHLEARMHRPSARTFAVFSTSVTIAAVVLAAVSGTGPVVGVFLGAALIATMVATLAWRATRSAERLASAGSHWATLVVVGACLLAAVIVAVNVPPYNDQDLPGGAWALMMLSLMTGVTLLAIGATTGLARLVDRHRLP